MGVVVSLGAGEWICDRPSVCLDEGSVGHLRIKFKSTC